MLPNASMAATPTKLGAFGGWQSFSLEEDGHPVCYMTLTVKPAASSVATPKSEAKKETKNTAKKKAATKTPTRGPITLMITHRPAENSTDVVSYNAGIKLRPASSADIKIDGKQSFNLFTQNDTAWSRDPATDHALTQAIRAGYNLTFVGTSARSSRVTDQISLKGSSAAYRAISVACGLMPATAEPKKAQKP